MTARPCPFCRRSSLPSLRDLVPPYFAAGYQGVYQILEDQSLVPCSPSSYSHPTLSLISSRNVMPLKRSHSRRQFEEDSSSDDYDYFILGAAQIVHSFSNVRRSHGGSVPGRTKIYRDRQGGHDRMFRDYLAVNPTFGPAIFRRRFDIVSLRIYLNFMSNCY